jgi:hypothetical protein
MADDGQDGGVTSGGSGSGDGAGAADGRGDPDGRALQEAVEELYGGSPEEFMTRRTALTAAAKQRGAKDLAKQIAALRKPSKSAAALNRLARQDTDGIRDLLDLGERLRHAERSVDAKQIRELTRERRTVLDTLTRRAFDVAGEKSPSAGVKEEVTSTLTAALADSTVAEQLSAGTLLTSASWEGFGFGGPPDLSLVPDRAEPTTNPKPAAQTPTVPRGASKAERDEAKKAAEEERREQAAVAAKEAQRVALDDARQAVDDAEEAVVLATDEEQVRMERLRDLEEQVAQARSAVDEARIQLRRAEIRRRRVGEALERLERLQR